MKIMTCKELGGGCDEEFKAETFEEIVELCKKHCAEMVNKGDKAHIKAMEDMRILMQNPEALQAWFKNRLAAFEALPKNETIF